MEGLQICGGEGGYLRLFVMPCQQPTQTRMAAQWSRGREVRIFHLRFTVRLQNEDKGAARVKFTTVFTSVGLILFGNTGITF